MNQFQVFTGLKRIWKKIPLVIRAIISGFLVSTIGVFTWVLAATFIPGPWLFPVMIILLWLYLRYFSGSWAPGSTAQSRKMSFRKVKLTGRVWKWSIIAGLLIVLFEQSGLVVTFRIIEFPADRFLEEYSFLGNIPVWMAWGVIFFTSAVAGICEETGFRGYMQLPIEKKYGPVTAIVIVSVVFVIVHLHQAWAGPIIFQIFLISVTFGLLAYYTGSLIPGIISHTIMDICNFSFWWSDLGKQFNEQPISKVGIDLNFLYWSLIFLLSIVLLALVFYNLSLEKARQPG